LDMKSALKSIIPKTKLHHFWHLKQSVKGMVGFYVRDLKNLLRYGPDCPRAFQLVFLSPEEITSTLIPKRFSEDDAGKVLPGDWDKKVKNLNEVKKWVTIHDALRAGLRWEDSGMFEHYSNSKKYSPDALKRRYQDLMGVVEKIRHDGYLKQRRELSPFNFRERGGIMVHIGSQGNPVFAGDGYHRLALAKICQFPLIPAAVGVVHEDAVIEGSFRALLERNRHNFTN